MIQNDTGYLFRGLYYVVVGEVVNTGDVPLRFDTITATFRTEDGRVVDMTRDYFYQYEWEWGCDLMSRYLSPGEKMPFRIQEADTAKSKRISSYTLGLEFHAATAPFDNPLLILDDLNSTNSEGWFLVTGEGRNKAAEMTSFSVIVGTFYDAKGKVIYVACSPTVPRDIPGREAYNFTLAVGDAEISARVSNYTLLAVAPLPLDHVVINEVRIGLRGGTLEEQSSWIELYNPTPTIVDLSGWTIYAERALETVNLPQGAVIPPRGYAVTAGVVICSKCSERLILRDKEGQEIDSTSWLGHIGIRGFTWQRYPDGSGNWRSALSTVDGINIAELPSPVLVAVMILVTGIFVLRRKVRVRDAAK